jgi:thioredoxin 1
MPFTPHYEESLLTRENVDAMTGPVVIEFGASWCGICRSFTPQAEAAFEPFPGVTHLRVEDGPGKRLGRSFRVKLWPTFVFMKDGQVLQISVRPTSADEVTRGLEAIAQTERGAWAP